MRQGCRSSGKRGFTLVELLAVIAIIAILLAILLPVLNMVQANARQGTCSTNIAEIIKGLKMYQEDWKDVGAPDALYGVQRDTLPFQILLGNPEYVKNPDVFTCPSAPPQFRKSNAVQQPLNRMTNAPAVDRQGRALFLAERSSYDMQYLPLNGSKQWVLNYSRKWTEGIAGASGYADDPRQLYRRDPPGDTVVTFCWYHANLDNNGVPSGDSMINVGFLSGRVQRIPGSRMSGWPGPDGKFPWQVTPK